MVNNRGLKKDLATSLAVVYLSLRENQNEFFNKMIEKVHWIFNLIISIPQKKKKKKRSFREAAAWENVIKFQHILKNCKLIYKFPFKV